MNVEADRVIPSKMKLGPLCRERRILPGLTDFEQFWISPECGSCGSRATKGPELQVKIVEDPGQYATSGFSAVENGTDLG